MKIKDVMTRDVATCRPEDSTSQAARLMWEHDCGVVPVVDAQQRPVGMITDRDVCMAGYTTGRSLWDIKVGDVMSRSIQSCSLEDSVRAAELAMQRRHVRRLPVVDSAGKLVGLLSLSDIARRASKSNTRPDEGLELEKVGETLASVCQPWCTILAETPSRPEALSSPTQRLVPVIAR
jgi:CBS domain-containing protein